MAGFLLGLGVAAVALAVSKHNANNDCNEIADNDYEEDDYEENDYEGDVDEEDEYEEYKVQRQKKSIIDREEAEHRVKVEQAKKDKRKASFIRLRSAIAHKKMINVNVEQSECLGKNYLQVISLFEKSGFNKIQTNIIEDLEYKDINRENLVTEVTVDGNNYFEISSRAKYNSDVIITFHKLRRIKPPMSYKTEKGRTSSKVIDDFLNAGFVNVQGNEIPDLKLGLFKVDGEIESISIGEDKKYKQETLYRIDTPVIITYHTFKNKKGYIIVI